MCLIVDCSICIYWRLKHRLSLVGTVAFDLALTAAAAFAADDHLRENVPVMVVETVFPGGSDPKATVSTRLAWHEVGRKLLGSGRITDLCLVIITIIQAAAGAGRTMLISDSGNVYSCGKDSFGEAEYGGQGSNVPGVDFVLSCCLVRMSGSLTLSSKNVKNGSGKFINHKRSVVVVVLCRG
ncbi:hypothetical protein YC2023_020982 [Brassica napus]